MMRVFLKCDQHLGQFWGGCRAFWRERQTLSWNPTRGRLLQEVLHLLLDVLEEKYYLLQDVIPHLVDMLIQPFLSLLKQQPHNDLLSLGLVGSSGVVVVEILCLCLGGSSVVVVDFEILCLGFLQFLSHPGPGGRLPSSPSSEPWWARCCDMGSRHLAAW